jgi:hypothetical protein
MAMIIIKSAKEGGIDRVLLAAEGRVRDLDIVVTVAVALERGYS